MKRTQEVTISRAYSKHSVTFVSKGKSMGIPQAAVEQAIGADIEGKKVYFRVLAKTDRLNVTLVLKPSFDPHCAQQPLAAWKVNAAGRRLYISFTGIAETMRLKLSEIADGVMAFKVEGGDILIEFPKKLVYEEAT